ncbi:glutaredoxin family protein [Cyanobium sp. ATX 6F1]|uniref:glutaredoxin family protein n=1 Tax=Cyanobium sp. ATX 6F1 TaxID=2823702 RepID=UPI0020CFC233|nr:glutaredoxin family protein [Cyanobium sp. ATX 6F1]MCP9915090.1 glutaredoxin family protein [Cyanobium sp. ATX 6F1]
MHEAPYRLYTRSDCCLCQGLEERLSALDPAPELVLIDVDTDPELQARYGLEVPVLAVRQGGGWRELPRVSPRLAGDGLREWLRKNSVTLPPA